MHINTTPTDTPTDTPTESFLRLPNRLVGTGSVLASVPGELLEKELEKEGTRYILAARPGKFEFFVQVAAIRKHGTASYYTYELYYSLHEFVGTERVVVDEGAADYLELDHLLRGIATVRYELYAEMGYLL